MSIIKKNIVCYVKKKNILLDRGRQMGVKFLMGDQGKH